MRSLTIPEIQKLDKGEVVPSVHGHVTSVFERRQGVNERGDWSVQDVLLNVDGDDIKIKFWNHDELQAIRGKEVTIRAYEGKNGLTSLFAEDDNYKGNTTRIIRATSACKIIVGLPNGDKITPEQEQSLKFAGLIPNDDIPMTHDSKGAALPGVDEARKHIMQSVNLYNLCVDAVDAVIKPIFTNMTAEMFQAATGTLFIEASRAGFVSKMPSTPLKK